MPQARRRVDTGLTEEEVVVWCGLACGTERQISDSQGTLWNLSRGTPSN